MDYALIGCGRVAPNHIKAARENGFHIAAVCDIDFRHIDALFERAGLSEEETQAIARYERYEEMLEKETLTLVSIALPSGLHAAAAKCVIAHGVNVIIEKPIAMSLPDADEIIRLGEEKGVVVSACHQNRFNLAVQAMRAAVEAGRFGALSNAAVTVRWSRGEDYYSHDDWRGKWASDGGTLMNQCIHGIDLLRWMCGDEIKTVYGKTARQYHPYIEAEDVGTAVIEFANGVLATVEGTVNVCGDDMEEHLTLLGKEGAVKLGGTCANEVLHWHFADDPEDRQESVKEKTVNVYGNGHTALFADVADAVRTGRQPYVDARAGRRALETVLAIYLSAKTGAPVSLPLSDVSSVDFEGLFENAAAEGRENA